MTTIYDYIAHEKKRLALYAPVLPVNSTHGAVMVETRRITDIDVIVKNHLFYLGEGWGLTICHSKDNENYMKAVLSDIEGIRYVCLDSLIQNASEYNALLTSETFWGDITYDKVLIFQHDSMLLRRGINAFMEYDYVGAPWAHIELEGGNGGLSLRSRQAMLEVVRRFSYDASRDGNEDIFFCKCMKDTGAKVAPAEVAVKFSVETIYYPLPIGIHAADKYLPIYKMSEILSCAIR